MGRRKIREEALHLVLILLALILGVVLVTAGWAWGERCKLKHCDAPKHPVQMDYRCICIEEAK